MKGMARKKIGLYNEDISVTPEHHLYIEISEEEMVLLSKSGNTQIEAFELFSLDRSSTDDWNDIFYEVKSASRFLNSGFRQVSIFFNVDESILIPEKLLTATSAEDYLNLIYGESTRHEVRYEKLLATKVFINAYRIRKSIIELLNRQFVIFQCSHTYSNLLNDVMRRPRIDDRFLKIQVYTHHFVVAFWKDERLQLIHAYRYHSAEDLLYYLLRITSQFSVESTECKVELSGMIDHSSILFTQIKNVFPNIQLDNMQAVGVFKAALEEYPAHYFTPFYKLTV